MELSMHIQSQLYLGLFERETHIWLRRLSEGAATAVDIGAAYGEYTLYFLKKTSASRVFSFEPDAFYHPFFRANLAHNDFAASDRLTFLPCAVGSADSGHEVRLVSEVDPSNGPCFVKMDVEGAEEEILLAAADFNRHPGVRWLIETHSLELERACERILKAAGFETRIVRNAWWRLLIPETRLIAHNRWLVAWKR